MRTFRILLVVIVILALLLPAISYWRFIVLEQKVDASWEPVRLVLQRQYELVPHLVNVVKGYMSDERTLFEEVTRVHSRWLHATTTEDQVKISNELSLEVGTLLKLAEDNADLGASEELRTLRDQFRATEDTIAADRQTYNRAVGRFMSARQRFPGNLYSALLGIEGRTCAVSLPPASGGNSPQR